MDDYGNKNHLLLFLAPIVAVIAILILVGLTKGIVDPAANSATDKTSKGTASEQQVDGDNEAENGISIFFPHADESPDGTPISATVNISGNIKTGDLPNYSDKDQAIEVTGTDRALANNAVKALKNMGYTNIAAN